MNTLQNAPHRADWMHRAKWGVFAHYLADGASATEVVALSSDEWNARVESFDVEALAAQLESVGAGYFGLTVGQNSGFYCAPNDAYDRITGFSPSKCSRRDLMLDVALALRKRGIRFMAYLPSKVAKNDAHIRRAFEPGRDWEREEFDRNPAQERMAQMQIGWNEVIREWSLNWGDLVSAWWIDGVYSADGMYRHMDEPNFGSLTNALRAGNSHALIAFNGGIKANIPRVAIMAGAEEDYTAGEYDFHLPVPGVWHNGASPWPGRFAGPPDAPRQFHILTFLGHWWGAGEPRFSPAFAREYTEMVNQSGGALTWDVPVSPQGRIPDEFLEHLSGLPRRDLAEDGI